MKKISILVIVCFFFQVSIICQTPQADDIQTPELSPFSVGGGSIQGAIANSVKEVTGKVSTSVPIANISARSVSYPVALTYNGDNVFKQAQYMNKYSPQGILGVGWGMGHPKIAADHKGTATREDDDYYLLDGSNNTKLVCTKKNVTEGPSLPGESYLEFQMEKYQPYKLRYHISFTDFEIVNGVGSFVTYTRDYWTLIDDNGTTYTYGGTENARENVIAWGNWIGDSKNTTGASKHTTGWNLSKIQDQWGNNLTFSYDKVEMGINTSGPKHTEASYLQQITSSTGGKIVFAYAEKPTNEYYEPHIEDPTEPDAYQERFETKYLDHIKTYNIENQLVYTYELGYNVVKKAASNDRNRYLQSVTQKDADNNALPSQEFEYHTTGTFEGGLNKVTYPTGGSITYNYSERFIFAGGDATITDGSITKGYDGIGRYAGNNYALRVLREGS